MKISVYKVVKDDDKINALGASGWQIILHNPFIIGVLFDMPDGEHLSSYKKWLEIRANASKDERRWLVKHGFKFRKIQTDEGGPKLVLDSYEPLLKWRLEFDYGSDSPVAYMTFGAADMNVPSYCAKELIDKYVPKEIIEQAISKGALYEDEATMEEIISPSKPKEA